MEPKVAFASGSFDPEVFLSSEYGKNALEMPRIVLEHPTEPMHPEVLAYWTSHGARKELFEAGTSRAWSVFTPVDLDRSGKYPLIYCSHGGGDDQYMAETYGYNLLVSPMQVICVYPQNGGRGSEEIEQEFPRILAELESRGYPVDRSRIYAAGFSAGSVASLRLAAAYPDRLAGVAPVPGPNAFRGAVLREKLLHYTENSGLQMPLICCGGMQDGGDAWPLSDEAGFDTLNRWMSSVGKAAAYRPMSVKRARELAADSDTVKRKFRLDFDETWIGYAEGTFWYCGQFYDPAQIPIARFVGIRGLPHLHCKMQAVEIFSYLRQFSRDLDTGEIIYTSENINHAKNS